MSISVFELNQFHGTEHYYRHWFGGGRLVYTEGVHYLVANGASWLVDAVFSYQRDRRIKNNPRLQDMQFWTLRVNKHDNTAVLTCVEDSGEPAVITQKIEYTDFPLDEFELWVERGSLDGENEVMVAMLPSER